MALAKQFRLLIVDDEAAEREGIIFLLEQNRYPFTTAQACNGREALAMLAQDRYDMMLADVKMPLMDGIALSAAAKRMYPDLIVVIISAYGDFEYTQQAIKTHVNDYLLKPVDVQEFRRTMDDALDSLGWTPAPDDSLPAEMADVLHYRQDKAIEEVLQDKPSEGPAGGRLVQSVMALIEENYMHDIGLEWLAGQVYLSPGYLSGLFKRATGKSVVQFITMRRMQTAREQIMKTNLKIVDIAQMVGYTNASYFCLMFRKYFGVTANQLREGTQSNETTD